MIKHLTISFVILSFVLANRTTVSAHCDSYDGPVILESKKALDNGNITPLLKWVQKKDEQVIRALFDKVRTVRSLNEQSKEIADQHFFETIVRIHRESEGAPFTGLKKGPIDPIEKMADQTLETGRIDSLNSALSKHLSEQIQKKHAQTVELRRHQDESVAAGRKYVQAYFNYLHYITGIHQAMTSTVTSRQTEQTAAPVHKH